MIMVRYKLIKNYPQFEMPLECNSVADGEYYTNKGVRVYNPENYPEFWEKIDEEKDYQILSFELNKKVFTIDETIKQCFSEDGNYANFSKYLKDNKILSVKRVSDNEIFTVGDKVKQSNVIHNNTFTIRGFEFDVNNKHLLVIGNGGIKLSKIEKVKTPLFTTEDGVDIFEDDTCIAVNIFSFQISNMKKYLETNGMLKYFSSKEKAEEWINLKKPYLSNQDVLDEISKCSDLQQLKNLFTNKTAN